MTKEKHVKKSRVQKKKDGPGVGLEKIVARVQQMMDSNSIVTRNEWLEDRVGNKRQYDVVIRGEFGGRAVLGVMECKDHSRKKGPDAVEAFAKKTENLGANLRIVVSKKGFTKQALKLAKHESIGCLSLLPEDPKQVGFSIGDMWYGVLSKWISIRLIIHFDLPSAPTATFDINAVKCNGKPVVNWFIRQLLTTHGNEMQEGEHKFDLVFEKQRSIEVEGKEYPVVGMTCMATRVYRRKKKWVNWSGKAFYDWHTDQFRIPANGTVVGSAVESDLSEWPDFAGEIPELGKSDAAGFVRAVIHNSQKWDDTNNDEVPDLSCL